MTIDRYCCSICIITCLSLPGLVHGQDRDYQSWYELELDYGFRNGIDLGAELGQRFRDNFLQYDRTLVTVTADYDLNPYLRVGGGVRALLRANREFELRPGYRVQADIRARKEWSRTEISLRNRLQYGFDEFMLLHDFGENNLADRTRFRLDHRFFGSRISLSGSLESWFALTGRSGRKFYKVRYSAGMEYMIDFRSDLSLRYILEDEVNVSNPLRAHILVLGYSYSL